MNNIRNFCIIAHIDHGKSTLADRLLEVTGTIDKRHMKAQFLDQLELERERGITIKMAPVRMNYTLNAIPYALNLIDTPGHSDFHYEVSRALAAVEGAILLVDATQGIQAQTLANFQAAQKAGLTIIGAVNKIDLNPPMLEEVIKSVAELIGVPQNEIYKVSGKTGQGVPELLAAVIDKIPSPAQAREILSQDEEVFSRSAGRGASGHVSERSEESERRNPVSPRAGRTNGSIEKKLPSDKIFRALIFDSFYHEHKGIVAGVRVFDGELSSGEKTFLLATKTEFKAKEIGHFAPELKEDQKLENGQIGYIATGLKDPELLKIGDTIIGNWKLEIRNLADLALPGYDEPQPVVFVSIYPEEADDYEDLKSALGKLKLNDSALKFEPDFNEFLGRGFKGGFLGRLHFEITAERVEREFQVRTVQSFPSVSYKVKERNGTWITVNNPKDFPLDYLEVREPIAKLEILTPKEYLSSVIRLQENFRLRNISTQTLGNVLLISANLPLADLIRDFDDQLKSVSAGYASLSYQIFDYQKADVVKLEVLVAGHQLAGLTRIVHREDIEKEARKTVERLKELLPKQQFPQALQAVANGRIIAREDIPAMKKLLGNFGKTGGDRTRKMKLWKKQQRGKERLKERAVKGNIEIPAKVFKELLKK
jgi:GTP-binding protein LepA